MLCCAGMIPCRHDALPGSLIKPALPELSQDLGEPEKLSKAKAQSVPAGLPPHVETWLSLSCHI